MPLGLCHLVYISLCYPQDIMRQSVLMSRKVPSLCEVQRLEQGFSTSTLTVCVGQVTCLVHCRMLRPIPDPYPGHGSSNSFLASCPLKTVTIKCLQIQPNVPWGAKLLSPFPHPPLRNTILVSAFFQSNIVTQSTCYGFFDRFIAIVMSKLFIYSNIVPNSFIS